ncbi:MAG: nuclear transport factor 2 family protein [Chitinophagales bacterium]
MKRWLPLFIVLLTTSCHNGKLQNQQYQEASASWVSDYFDAFNRHDWQTFASFYADTCRFLDPSLGVEEVKQSREEVRDRYAQLGAVIADVQDSVISTYHSSQDEVVIEFISMGTDKGGRFRLPICTIFKLREGKIISDHTYYDNF